MYFSFPGSVFSYWRVAPPAHGDRVPRARPAALETSVLAHQRGSFPRTTTLRSLDKLSVRWSSSKPEAERWEKPLVTLKIANVLNCQCCQNNGLPKLCFT